MSALLPPVLAFTPRGRSVLGPRREALAQPTPVRGIWGARAAAREHTWEARAWLPLRFPA